MKYRVLFIDEEEDQHDTFQEYMEHATELDVVCKLPAASLDEMIQIIETVKPDAIVTDFFLNEHREAINYNVEYNGAELVKAFEDIRPLFPCFVLTSYDDQAIHAVSDVNLVYVKRILHQIEKNDTALFYMRIYEQISKYKASIVKAQKELTYLTSKRAKGQTTLQEDQKLIELDRFIEKSLGADYVIPDDMKSTSNIEKLTDLIQKVDFLIDRLK